MGDLLAFEAFPKIDRYTNETFTITEKIDGTNACVSFTEDGTLTAQSRNRIIVLGADNAGFAAWAHSCAKGLFTLLGPGRHYGEWWGKGVQRNYGLDHKVFSLFNTHRWEGLEKIVPSSSGFVGIRVVPVLAHGTLNVLDESLGYAHFALQQEGSVAAPGFMDPEGCMIYLHRLGRYLKAPLDATPKSGMRPDLLHKHDYDELKATA